MFEQAFGRSSSKVLRAKEVYNVIRKYGIITKKDLLKILEMPPTTLNRAFNDLLSIGLIEEGGICESEMGRRPIAYKVKSGSFYLAGVEISRTTVKIIFTDMSLTIIHKICFDINGKIDPVTLVKRIADEIRNSISQMNIGFDKILGIGVGTVGSLDREKGEILEVEGFSHNGWNKFPIKLALEKELGVLTILNDGANAAVLAEYWSDIGKKHVNMIYVSIGIGFRCGILSHGFLQNNRNHVSNDIYGHIVVSAGGKPCYCGNQGCVESYVSIPAIVQSYCEGNESVSNETEQTTWKRICESVKYGDKLSLNVITEAAFYLSTGLVNIINTINPEAVILGGAAINTCSIFYDLAVSLAKEKLSNINSTVTFYKGNFGEDEMAVGAATLVLDYYLGNEISEVVLDLA